MSKKKRTPGSGRPVKYPWERWFQAKRLTLRRTDGGGRNGYSCQTHSMAQQIRNAAWNRGIKVSLHIERDGTIVVTRKGAAG